MANIDTSTIEGYADMTAEQKVAALEGYSMAEPDYSGYVKKDLYDKAAHDAAEWKKKHNALMSDDEKAKAAVAEANQAKDDKIAELTRIVSVSENTSKFLALGYSAELAKSTAEAMADGNNDVLFANQQKFMAEQMAKMKAEILKGTSNPVGDGGDGTVDYDAEAQKCLDNGDMAGYSHWIRKKTEKQK